MSDHSNSVTRRDLFRAFVRPFSKRLSELNTSLEDEQQVIARVDHDTENRAHNMDDETDVVETPTQEAVIQGRFCLAYQGGVCFTCSERCPVPGAITTKQGVPTVHSDICTGCGICHDLCPAPRNAILMIDRRDTGGISPAG